MPELVLVLSGEFDISNARQINDLVAGALNSCASSRLVLDLEGVSFLDCAAIRSILYAQRQAASRGRELVVRNPAPIIGESFRILGLAKQLYGGPRPPSRVREHEHE